MDPQTQEAPVARKRAPAKKSTKATAKKVVVIVKTKAEAKAAEKKVANEAAKKALPALAHEINSRFELAAKIEGKADDHRLAAALQLAKAEEMCKAGGIDWKKWVEKNVKQSYETARKLVAVGKAPKPKLALADMRKSNAERNKAHREKTKKAAKTNGAPAEAHTAPAILSGVEALQAAFSDLKPKDRVDFVKWAAGETGYKLVDEFETATPAKVAEVKAPVTGSRRRSPPTDQQLADEIPPHLKK